MRGKSAGRKCYTYYSPDSDSGHHDLYPQSQDLHKAMQEGQLKIYHQPLVNLENNEVLAVEALLRWEHPERGMIPPNEFIPMAEETGFIIELGKWLLHEVCRNYQRWVKRGLTPIKVSVNYSSIQFSEERFADNIRNTINEYGLDPHFLIIEITESVLMTNAGKAISDIQKLQAMGIQVALDDFGTGFSSLAYLSTFHIDILKIDGSFVQKIPFNQASTIITRSVINLARDLKIKVVAEGIETLEQLSCLKSFHCHTGQGYLYSRPIPIHEFEKILAKGQCLPRLKIEKLRG